MDVKKVTGSINRISVQNRWIVKLWETWVTSTYARSANFHSMYFDNIAILLRLCRFSMLRDDLGSGKK